MAAEEAGDAILLADALLVLARVAMFAARPDARQAGPRSEPSTFSNPCGMTPGSRLRSPSWRGHTATWPPSVSSPNPARGQRLWPSGRWASRNAWDVRTSKRRHRATSGMPAWRAGTHAGRRTFGARFRLAGSDSRVETRVRSYVNAAHGAYRSGRFADADRFVAEGLRVAADGEFFAGQYRLRLTAAAVHGSRGEWDRAIADLRALLDSPGEPGVMAALARSILARLLARRGDRRGRRRPGGRAE